jgi:hypothetical protein
VTKDMVPLDVCPCLLAWGRVYSMGIRQICYRLYIWNTCIHLAHHDVDAISRRLMSQIMPRTRLLGVGRFCMRHDKFHMCWTVPKINYGCKDCPIYWRPCSSVSLLAAVPSPCSQHRRRSTNPNPLKHNGGPLQQLVAEEEAHHIIAVSYPP